MRITSDIKLMKENVDLSSLSGLCKSISFAGSYIGTMPLVPTIDEYKLKKYRAISVRLAAYKEFEIPKKNGETRKILAPSGELKQLMSVLNFILNAIYTPTDSAMGFVCERSVLTNANHHLNQNYVLNLDLSDFFPSISSHKVESSLVAEGVSPLVASLISTICTFPRREEDHYVQTLPQGAPTSPVLSNICCRSLDKQLTGLADRFHLNYTRYADDITFSSNHNVYQADGEFWQELKRIIAAHNFILNEKKTRLQKRGSRQEVTGVTVGVKANVSRTYIKNLRAMIHNLASIPLTNHFLNVVRGKLNYLRMIKGADDSTYRTLCIKFNAAIKGRVPKKRKKRRKIIQKKS